MKAEELISRNIVLTKQPGGGMSTELLEIYNQYVIPGMTYGCETWKLTK